MSYNGSFGVKTDFYIVMIIPITFSVINFLGTLYIFYRTFLRWKSQYYGAISLSFRLPFYIAITDFLFASTTLTNFLYSSTRLPNLLNGELITWPSPFCDVLGFISTVSILLNITLVGVISITTWVRVVQEYYIKFGKNDYKIWTPVIFLSFFIPLVTVNEFGPQKYWCGGNNNSLLTELVLITIGITLLIIIFCYVHVLRTIHNANDDNSIIEDPNSNSLYRSDIEKRSLKKVLAYIFVFILQYIPIVIFNIFGFLKIQHVLLFALGPAAISIGGIGNVIQYISNEGLAEPSFNGTSNHRLELSEQQSNHHLSMNIMSEIDKTDNTE